MKHDELILQIDAIIAEDNPHYDYPAAIVHKLLAECRTALTSSPEAPTRNWKEDSAHENGNYQCICSTCGETFMGHKRRVTCKLCVKPRKLWKKYPEDKPFIPYGVMLKIYFYHGRNDNLSSQLFICPEKIEGFFGELPKTTKFWCYESDLIASIASIHTAQPQEKGKTNV